MVWPRVMTSSMMSRSSKVPTMPTSVTYSAATAEEQAGDEDLLPGLLSVLRLQSVPSLMVASFAAVAGASLGGHARDLESRSPRMPCGRNISTITRMVKAMTSLSWPDEGTPRPSRISRRADGLGLTQDEAADHRAGDVADAAEDGGGEGLDAGDEAGEELNLAPVAGRRARRPRRPWRRRPRRW